MRPNIADRESAEDLFFGQVVIIAARYSLIAGLVLVYLTALTDSRQMALAMVPVVIFLGVNFFLHARYLMERPANLRLVVVASVVDVVLITYIVAFGPGARGFESPFFVLYYPVILAFGFVVPRRIEVQYTGLAVALYAGAALISGPGLGALATAAALKELVLRLVTLAACGAIANFYWRVLRARRRDALATRGQ